MSRSIMCVRVSAMIAAKVHRLARRQQRNQRAKNSSTRRSWTASRSSPCSEVEVHLAFGEACLVGDSATLATPVRGAREQPLAASRIA